MAGRKGKNKAAQPDTVRFSDVLASLSSDLVAARDAAAHGDSYGLGVAEAEIELTLGACEDTQGSAGGGVKLYVFTLGADARKKSQKESLQRVKLTLRPADVDDEPMGGDGEDENDLPPDEPHPGASGSGAGRGTEVYVGPRATRTQRTRASKTGDIVLSASDAALIRGFVAQTATQRAMPISVKRAAKVTRTKAKSKRPGSEAV